MAIDEKKMRAAGKGMFLNALGYSVIQLLREGQALDVSALQAQLRLERDRLPIENPGHYSFQVALEELQEVLESSLHTGG